MIAFKEKELENRLKVLENKINKLESIPQISNNATINDIILVINKITNSLKRKR